jgi:hypothetical protein
MLPNVNTPAASALAVYQLTALFGSHPHQKSALSLPFYLALAMIFHAESPCSGNNKPFKTTTGIIHQTRASEKHLSKMASRPKRRPR